MLWAHFETEAEYGFTDQLRRRCSIQHYFYNKGVDGARDDG